MPYQDKANPRPSFFFRLVCEPVPDNEIFFFKKEKSAETFQKDFISKLRFVRKKDMCPCCLAQQTILNPLKEQL